jgi:3-oxoacyl-[acyl-carrier protein] reductase
MFDLTGKAALVTGASGGIGGAIARALHGQGATVALSGTRAEALEAAGKAELGDRAHVVAARPGRRRRDRGLVEGGGSRHGRQARHPRQQCRHHPRRPAMRMKDEDWDGPRRQPDRRTFRLTRAAMRGMMKKRFGRIINITSVVGVTGNPGQANYAPPRPA